MSIFKYLITNMAIYYIPNCKRPIIAPFLPLDYPTSYVIVQLLLDGSYCTVECS